MLHQIADLQVQNPGFDFIVDGDNMIVSVYDADGNFDHFILIG